jgi:peptidoglycan-associated lipoprotein
MKKHTYLALAMAATLAACGSSVKLEDVPVEDRSGRNIGTVPVAPAGGQTGQGRPVDPNAGSQSRVAPVAAESAANKTQGPVDVGRIVYFDYDSFILKPEFQPLVESHARHLRANPARQMTIEGHTDERGGREYNLALGQKRAEAVRRALTLLGVTDRQVEAVSFGKEKPTATGSDETAYAKNRRAELAYR